jgi:hypothetical protein
MTKPTPQKAKARTYSTAVRNTVALQRLFAIGAVLGGIGLISFRSGTSKFNISLAAFVLFLLLAIGLWIILKDNSFHESDRRLEDDEADALLKATEWTAPPELAAHSPRLQFSILKSDHAKATAVLTIIMLWIFLMVEVTSPAAMESRALYWLSAAVSILIAGYLTMADALRLARLFRIGQPTPAVVVEIQRLGKHPQHLRAVVRFRVGDSVYEVRSQSLERQGSYALGVIVTILFNPTRPSDAVIFESLQ